MKAPYMRKQWGEKVIATGDNPTGNKLIALITRIFGTYDTWKGKRLMLNTNLFGSPSIPLDNPVRVVKFIQEARDLGLDLANCVLSYHLLESTGTAWLTRYPTTPCGSEITLLQWARNNGAMHLPL